MLAVAPLIRRGIALGCVIFGFGSPLAAAELSVVATIKPVHALVAQVMAGVGQPALLVRGSASPHTFSLRPSDAKSLAHADLVFRVSLATEPFTAKLAAQLPKGATLVTLATVPGITPLPRRAGGTFDVHSHGDHDHDHDHDKAEANGQDGHVWLDPANGAAMLDAIAEALATKAPAQAATFRANATQAKVRLAAVSQDIQAGLKPLAGRSFILFHDATQYFETRFGLAAAGAITTDPDIPASGKRLSSLRARLAKAGVGCVFSEPNFDAKVVAAIVEGSKVRTVVIDPEGARLDAGPGLYEALLRGLARSFADCLAP
jgi:zinc transport system substrate-binding protein